ncbi:LysR family transcriptional regulator [Actinoallomurus acanthiterrae]
MFEVRRLRLLWELAAHGTIAAVAEACALSPSAVSQQLSLLEREVRTPLLIRDGRRLVLTEAARILVAHTERILAEMEQARAEMAALDHNVRGTVGLVAFPSAAGVLAAPAIAECQTTYPDLRVLLGEEEPEQSVAGLRARRIDVALVYEYNVLPRLHDAGIELQPLLHEPLLLALPPMGGGGSGSLEELSQERWIAPGSDSALRSVLVRACNAAGFDPQLDYISDDYRVIMALVQAGVGVSLIPRLAAEQLAAEVRLQPVTDLRLSRTVSVAVRSGSGGDPAIAALVRALRRVAGCE